MFTETNEGNERRKEGVQNTKRDDNEMISTNRRGVCETNAMHEANKERRGTVTDLIKVGSLKQP